MSAVFRIRRAVERFREAHRRARAEGERGATLVEVVVAMTIMLICGSIFTGAVVTLHRTSNQAQAITNAASQNNQAYQTLERTVRYASAISTPGPGAGGNWYVELRDTTSGAEVCTQLRVAGGQLQSRTWTATTPATPSTWVPLASGVTNGAAASGAASQPFVVPTQVAPATQPTPTALPSPTAQPTQSATLNRQQLKVTLVTQAGSASQRVSSTSSYTLTALNSTVPPATGAICQQVARS